MRALLLRLGFIGAEYTQLRRALLARLEGDSAWAKSLKPSSPTADPVGSLNSRRVQLARCKDPYTNLEAGAEGTMLFVDAASTVHVDWDNGSTLGLVKWVDQWRLNEVKEVQSVIPEKSSIIPKKPDNTERC